jgi:hypothetical protein
MTIGRSSLTTSIWTSRHLGCELDGEIRLAHWSLSALVALGASFSLWLRRITMQTKLGRDSATVL